MKRLWCTLLLFTPVLASCASTSVTWMEPSAVHSDLDKETWAEAQSKNESRSPENSDEPQQATSEEIHGYPFSVSLPGTTALLGSLISNLSVAEEMTDGYDRDLFKHWTDDDGDDCNTRYEVLIEESLTEVQVGSGCTLSGGTWVSAFDLTETTDPSTLDIDHFVPLKEAWDSGAWAWDAATREAYANDLGYEMSLIAVSMSSNRSKSDRDPTTWLPTNDDYWCEYITAWVQVKTRWSLSVDVQEKLKLESMVEDCTGEMLDFAPRPALATSTPSP